MTKTIEKDVLVPTEKDVIAWLESEYLRKDGTSILDLVYIDYRDDLSDDQVQEAIKDGYISVDEWVSDCQYDSIAEIFKQYRESIKNGANFQGQDIVTDEVENTLRDWCLDHDTSDPLSDLLKNTGSKLFFIETIDEFVKDEIVENGFMTDKQYPETVSNNQAVIKKYAKTDEQKKEIESTFDESFYSAQISFYFYANALEVYEAVHGSTDQYITIEGAYCSTVDRSCGSNWLGDSALFTVSVPRQSFIENVYLDSAKDTGYSWHETAGQAKYDDACVMSTKTIKGVLIETNTGDILKQETEYNKKWDSGRGSCTFGDMNIKRHKSAPYKNEFPCGNTCEACGTFWID